MATSGAFTTNSPVSFNSMLQNYSEAFSESLTNQLDSSKLVISIGSMNVYVEESCDLFEPFYANIYYFKSEIYASQG